MIWVNGIVFVLMVGFLVDMYFIAFSIGKPREEVAGRLVLPEIIDIIMALNIVFNFFKVYQEDGPQRDL